MWNRWVRVDTRSAAWHDVQDARERVDERCNSLQDANLELEQAHIARCVPPASWPVRRAPPMIDGVRSLKAGKDLQDRASAADVP